MLSKTELAGIALSIAAMSGALYLITSVDAPKSTKPEAVEPAADVIFVPEGEDNEANLRKALLEASDENGAVVKLVIDDVVIGNGPEAKSGDLVSVHYVGTLQNGQEFDSSIKRNQPFTFTIGEGKVIKGWETGVVGMKEGGQRILVVPSDLAYGKQGYGPIPGKATLIFSIELIKVGL